MEIVHSAGYSGQWAVGVVDIEGWVLDLSVGGATLFAKQNFEIGQKLRLSIKTCDGIKIAANAVVLWGNAVPDKDGFVAGVQLEQVVRED